MSSKISNSLREKVLLKTKNRCAYCGIKLGWQIEKDKPEKYIKHELDHVMPKRRGGTNKIENLLPCCRLCNLSKRSRTLKEYKIYIKEFTIQYLLKEKIYHKNLPEELQDKVDKKLNEAIAIINNSPPIMFYFETIEGFKNE